jgi:hypothetical protein
MKPETMVSVWMQKEMEQRCPMGQLWRGNMTWGVELRGHVSYGLTNRNQFLYQHSALALK